MTNSAPFPIFDGHNDILLKLLEECPNDPAKAFFTPRKGQHIDLQSAQKGGFIGGLFAMFIPPEDGKSFRTPPSQEFARDYTMNMITLMRDIAAESDGQVQICRSVSDIRTAMAEAASPLFCTLKAQKRYCRTSPILKCFTKKACDLSALFGADQTLSRTAYHSSFLLHLTRAPA